MHMSLIIAKKLQRAVQRITLRFIITILFPSFNNASSKVLCLKVVKKILKGKGLKQKLFEKNKKWIENILSSTETYTVTS